MLTSNEATIPTALVKEMLGGKWPDSGDSKHWPSGFSFDDVPYFKVEDGYLVPWNLGEPLPGPDFKLVIV